MIESLIDNVIALVCGAKIAQLTEHARGKDELEEGGKHVEILVADRMTTGAGRLPFVLLLDQTEGESKNRYPARLEETRGVSQGTRAMGFAAHVYYSTRTRCVNRSPPKISGGKMKKLFWLIGLIVLVVVVGPSVVIAGSPLNGSAASVFFVQNTSASYSANCTYTVYNNLGAVASTQSFTVAPNDRKVVSMVDVTGINPGTRGTGKVNCDQPVAVLSLYSNPPAGGLNSSGAAFEGKTASTGPWYAPENYYNYSGFYSELVVYNTSDWSTTWVTATFYDPSGNQVGSCTHSWIPAHTSTTFTMPCGSMTSNVSYSAVINSSDAVVPVVNWYRLDSPALGTYSPISVGSTIVQIPYVMNNYLGFNTALTVQNVGTQPTDITVSYSTGGGETRYGVAPNGVALFFPGNGGVVNTWASAVVTAMQPLVAIENESGPNNRAGSFTGFSGGLQTAYAPNMFYHFSGFNSSVTCQNVGGGGPTDMTISYSGIVTTTTKTNVQPAQSVVFYDADMFSDPAAFLGGWSGAAKVVSSSQPIACVVAIDQNDSPYSTVNMDQTYIYNAFRSVDTATTLYLPMLFAPTVDSRFAIVAARDASGHVDGLGDENRLGLVTGQYSSYEAIDELTKIQVIRTKGFLDSGGASYPPCVWDEVYERVLSPTVCSGWISSHLGKEWIIGNEPEQPYVNGGDALCVAPLSYSCGRYAEMFYNVRQFIRNNDSSAFIIPASWSSNGEMCSNFNDTEGLWIEKYNATYYDAQLGRIFYAHGPIDVNAWSYHSYYFQDDTRLTCFVSGLNTKRNEGKIVNPIDNIRITEVAYDHLVGCAWNHLDTTNCTLEIVTMLNLLPRLRLRTDVSRWYWFQSRSELIYSDDLMLTPAGKCYKQIARQPWCFP